LHYRPDVRSLSGFRHVGGSEDVDHRFRAPEKAGGKLGLK